MAQLFSGILAIGGAESFLDNQLIIIDDQNCDGDLECRARRARDFFVNRNIPQGTRITVCGTFSEHEPDGNGGRNNVIHMFRDNAPCQGGDQ